MKKLRPQHFFLNLAMKSILGKQSESFWLINTQVPTKLLKKLKAGFEWNQECLFYKGSVFQISDKSKTSVEYFASQTFVIDYMRDKSTHFTLKNLVWQSFSFSFALAESLCEHSKNFTIYISTSPENLSSEFKDCCVQFHLDRPDESAPLYVEDIYQPSFSKPTAILKFEI